MGSTQSTWGPLHDQDQEETGDKGREEDDVRQGSRCQGEASEDGREGLRRRGVEEGVQVIESLACLAGQLAVGFLAEWAQTHKQPMRMSHIVHDIFVASAKK